VPTLERADYPEKEERANEDGDELTFELVELDLGHWPSE
jgi:hypothetical protein